jgi:hypothetical protein
MQTTTGLENAYQGDWVMLYNLKTGYKKLAEVSKKSKTQITIKDGTKYRIMTGEIVPNCRDHQFLLRGLTEEEIDDLDKLEAREFLISSIKEELHSLQFESLIELDKWVKKTIVLATD